MSLDFQDTIKRLESYNDATFPILSVYFHTVKDSKSTLKQLEEFLNSNLNDMQKTEIGQNIEYMQGLIQQYQPMYENESVAIFSGDTVLFEMIHLPYLVPNHVTVSHSPFLQPLLEQQAAYHRYLVILVDRAQAKFFTLARGNIEKQDQLYDPSVPQNVHPDTSEALYANREDKNNRHIQDHLHRHFARVGEKVSAFVEDVPIQGVIIGGHKMYFQQFERYLPSRLKNKIVGEFVSELNTNMNTLVKKALLLYKKLIMHLFNKNMLRTTNEELRGHFQRR